MSEDNNKKDELDENEKTGKLFKDAFRFPKTGVIEKLVVQHLLQATFTNEPQLMIYHVKTAVGIVEKLPNKNLTKLDFPLFKRIGVLNNAFSIPRKLRQRNGDVLFQVPWGFSALPENYENYIKPWVVFASFYPNHIKFHRKKAHKIIHTPKDSWGYSSQKNCGATLYIFTDYDEKQLPENSSLTQIREYLKLKLPSDCPVCGYPVELQGGLDMFETTIADINAPEWSFFFDQSNCLTELEFSTWKRAFEKWATDYCEHAITYLSSIVSPHTYDEVLKLLSGKTGSQKPQKESENF